MSDGILDVIGDPHEELTKSETIYGVVPAIVTNIKDEEKLGRIKVNFPWLAESSESDWVRVVYPYAGSSRGIYFLPEVGDEVLVAFQKGQVSAPYVIGSLWSNKAKPPEENADGKNAIKLIKTKGGHTITLDETDSKGKIEIKSNAGHTVTLDDTSGSEKVEIKDKSGSNKVTIETTPNKITIESGLDLNLKSTNITVEATANLTLKGAMIKAEATGITEIKGSMVKIN